MPHPARTMLPAPAAVEHLTRLRPLGVRAKGERENGEIVRVGAEFQLMFAELGQSDHLVHEAPVPVKKLRPSAVARSTQATDGSNGRPSIVTCTPKDAVFSGSITALTLVPVNFRAM